MKTEEALNQLKNEGYTVLKTGINDNGDEVALQIIEQVDENVYVYRFARKPYVDPKELKEIFIGETIEDVRDFLEKMRTHLQEIKRKWHLILEKIRHSLKEAIKDDNDDEEDIREQDQQGYRRGKTNV